MPQYMNYLPVSAIVEEWIALSGATGRVSKIDIERRAASTARRLSVPTHMRFKIALIDVVGYRAILPEGFKQVVEVAYGPQINGTQKQTHEVYTSRLKSARIPCSWPDDGKCEFELNLKCSKCSEDKCECESSSFEVSYSNLSNMEQFVRENQQPSFAIGGYSTVGPHGGRKRPLGSSSWVEEMRLMRPATQTFAMADSHVGGCLNLNKGALAQDVPEYTIEGQTLRCNVPNGMIVLAYMETPTDEDGMVMIPDQEDFIAAVVWDIEWHMLYKDVRSGRTGASARGNLLGLADQQRGVYSARARRIALSPSPTEFEEIIQSEMMRHLPNVAGRSDFNRRRSDHIETVMQRIAKHR